MLVEDAGSTRGEGEQVDGVKNESLVEAHLSGVPYTGIEECERRKR